MSIALKRTAFAPLTAATLAAGFSSVAHAAEAPPLTVDTSTVGGTKPAGSARRHPHLR